MAVIWELKQTYEDGYLPSDGGLYQQNNRYVELLDLVKAVTALSDQELDEERKRKEANPNKGQTNLLKRR